MKRKPRPTIADALGDDPHREAIVQPKPAAPARGRRIVPLHSVGIRLPFDLFDAIRSYLVQHQAETGLRQTFNESMIEAVENWARSKGIKPKS